MDFYKLPPERRPKTQKEYEQKFGDYTATIGTCAVHFKPGVVPQTLPFGFTGYATTQLKLVYYNIMCEYKQPDNTRAGFNKTMDEIDETMQRLYMWAVRLPRFSR